MKYMFRAIAVLALIVFTSPYVMAGQVGAINTFTANTPARADEVNANFNVLKTEINANDTRITINTTKSTEVTANGAAISLNTSNIGANSGNIGLNSGRIDANSDTIGTNSGSIGTNSSRIDGKLTNTVGTCINSGESIRQIFSDGAVACGRASTSSNSIEQIHLVDGIPGVAWSENSNPVPVTDDEKTTPVIRVIITPPTGKTGYFVASASGQMHKGIDSIAKFLTCGLSKGLPDSFDLDSWVRFKTNNRDQTISLDSVFPSDGTQKSIYLLCRRENKPNEVFPNRLDPLIKEVVEISNANLNVIFVPMNYNTP